MMILKKQTVDICSFSVALDIANELEEYMNRNETVEKIVDSHKLHAKSYEVQTVLLEKLVELGFDSEKKSLFKKYGIELRPDYYKRLDSKAGIIIEVERGKTIDNNMDLLDIWKCHICEEANYLFLVVPEIRQTKKGKNINIFTRVCKRLSVFYNENNYINVDAIFVFKY